MSKVNKVIKDSDFNNKYLPPSVTKDAISKTVGIICQSSFKSFTTAKISKSLPTFSLSKKNMDTKPKQIRQQSKYDS